MVFNITSSILTALKFELSKLRFNINCINSIDIDVNNDNKKLDFIFINFLLCIKANTFNGIKRIILPNTFFIIPARGILLLKYSTKGIISKLAL